MLVSKILLQQSTDSDTASVSSGMNNHDDTDLLDTKPKAVLPPFQLESKTTSIVAAPSTSGNTPDEGKNVSSTDTTSSQSRSMHGTERKNIIPTISIFDVGDIVQVQPRTGPGMNRLGGIAEITNVYGRTAHNDDDGTVPANVLYDVRYVLNRRQREHGLQACYISAAPDYNNISNKNANTTIDVSNKAPKKRYLQRRSCPNPVSVLPSPLRAALLADGCDVDGIATRKALAQYNNKTCTTTSDKENTSFQNGQAKTKEVVQKSNMKRKELITKTTMTHSTQTKSRQPPTKRIKSSQHSGSANGNVEHQNDCYTTSWTNTMKCQLADDLYRTQIETALRKGVIYISTSLLSIIEQEELQQLCQIVHKKMKGAMIPLRMDGPVQRIACLFLPTHVSSISKSKNTFPRSFSENDGND
jgi:hypothetical protein